MLDPVRRTRLAGGLLLVALALLATGTAIARHTPAYLGKHHTRVTPSTAWELSYMGSSTWTVTETATNADNGEHQTWDEGSSEGWHFDVPKENAQASTFSVAYPTSCREFRGYPCPGPQQTGVGNGPSTMNFDIHDSNGSGGTIDCMGEQESHVAGTAIVTATYIKATDSYKLKIDNEPLSPGLAEAGADQKCPGPDDNRVNVLDVWTPPDLPSGGANLLDWWSAASVTIPARTFATNSQIDIPVSVSVHHEAPPNCGIPAGYVKCKAIGSWSGTLVLHRAAG